MTIETLIRVHERLNSMGNAVFEQFVDVAEQADADSIVDLIENGELNPNALDRIIEVIRELKRDVRNMDHELFEELDELSDACEESLDYITA